MTSTSDADARLDASVILCVRNGEKTIRAQLDSLEAQRTSRVWELIVVDNGSSDSTLEVVEAWRRAATAIEARIVDAGHVRGLAAARNAGAEKSRGHVLMFCDADDVATPDWIEALADALESADMVGGPLDYHVLNDSQTRSWQMRSRPRFDEQLPGTPNMPFAIGANMGIRAAMYRQVCGCDDALTGAWDDVDLSLRVAAAGGVLALAPLAVMHYRLRASLKDALGQARHYGRGEALVRRKYGRGGPLPPMDGKWIRSTLASLVGEPSKIWRSEGAARERLLAAAYTLGLLMGLAREQYRGHEQITPDVSTTV